MEQIEESFLRPFIQATIKTLKVLCKTEVTLERIAPASEIEKAPVAIAGVIGITGKHFQGAMILSFSKVVFLSLMNQMLDENHTEIDDLADGAAELSNIIFGHAKIALNSSGHDIKMALPSVMKGDDLKSGAPISLNASVILLNTPVGAFTIEFAGRVIAEEASSKIQIGEAEAAPGAIPKLDGHVLMSFVRGVRQTFKVQCKTEAVAGTPFRKDLDHNYHFEIGSMIGVTGAAFGGTIAMCFEKNAFITIVEKMLNEKVSEISNEFEDAATEIMNIAFGVAKQVLNEQGYALNTAIPTIIRGRVVESLYPSRRPPIVVPFQVSGGTFWVEFALDPDTRNGKA